MYTEWTIPPNKYPKHYPDGLHKTAGPFDIALIKMRVGVTLIPGRVVPVGEFFFFGIFLFYMCTVQACLGSIKDQRVSGVVQGCFYFFTVFFTFQKILF